MCWRESILRGNFHLIQSLLYSEIYQGASRHVQKQRDCMAPVNTPRVSPSDWGDHTSHAHGQLRQYQHALDADTAELATPDSDPPTADYRRFSFDNFSKI
ncbi:sarcoglycan, epsilon, isoform CRA_a [Rattus norvegicus]|uniref:Sarcoglycan, epsilon, isoform CRA_a n=2 Tax=Rattus norvegicus TaxID=10116 RepID=A6IDS1_RAT|nr:sarcoglycan, epsilon, isoform CRA_a [Rattus norvegicus]